MAGAGCSLCWRSIFLLVPLKGAVLLLLHRLLLQINVSGFSIPDGARSMVSINEPYLEHGIIHIVRVSPSQKFKALLHGHPIILESRRDPYVFNDPTFRKAEATDAASFVNVNDRYIQNQSLHEIRLDEGEVCLVWIDNKCVAQTAERMGHARVWVRRMPAVGVGVCGCVGVWVCGCGMRDAGARLRRSTRVLGCLCAFVCVPAPTSRADPLCLAPRPFSAGPQSTPWPLTWSRLTPSTGIVAGGGGGCERAVDATRCPSSERSACWGYACMVACNDPGQAVQVLHAQLSDGDGARAARVQADRGRAVHSARHRAHHSCAPGG